MIIDNLLIKRKKKLKKKFFKNKIYSIFIFLFVFFFYFHLLKIRISYLHALILLHIIKELSNLIREKLSGNQLIHLEILHKIL